MFRGLPQLTRFASGSAGALPDITLSQQTPSTWKDKGLLTAMPTAPEPSRPDTTATSISTSSTSTSTSATSTSTSILPTGEQPEEGGVVLLAEVEPGLTAQEKEATHPPSETTLHPTTHRASTARATTAQGPATSHPHRDVQPDHHETSAPTGHSQPEPQAPSVEDGGSSATEKAAEDEASTQLPGGEDSGEQVGVGPLSSSAFPGTLGGQWVGWPLVPGGAQCIGWGALAWTPGTANPLRPVSTS